MKRLRIFAPLMALLMLLAACAPVQEPDEPSEPAASGTAATMARAEVFMLRELAQDGLLLRVSTNYQEYAVGESILLEATVTNTGDKAVTYGAGSSTPDVHQEIPVEIGRAQGAGFVDRGLYGRFWTDDYGFAVLQPGESVTLSYEFLPGYPQNSSGDLRDLEQMNWYPAGEYTGTAAFTRYSGTGENPGEATRMELEFPVVLVGEGAPSTTTTTTTTSTSTSTKAPSTPVTTEHKPSTAASTIAHTKTKPAITLFRELEEDGVLLKVYLYSQYHFTGETVVLEASVTNTGDAAVTYGAGSSSPYVQQKILVEIEGPSDGFTRFIDHDTYGMSWLANYRYAVLQPGESVTQIMRFLPGVPQKITGDQKDLLEMNWFPAGVYTGTARFTRYSGTSANPGEATELRLEFPVELV